MTNNQAAVIAIVQTLGLIVLFGIYRALKKPVIIVTTPAVKPWAVNIVFFISSRIKIKGIIMETNVKIGQRFLAIWGKPKDKGGNNAEVENIQFVSDDDTVATIAPATQADLDDYNNQFPESGEGSENRIPADQLPYAGVVTSLDKLSATQVGITADGEIGEGEKIISSKLTVTVGHGDATTFGDAKLGKAADVPA